MVNYHRHSFFSNPFTAADSCVSNEDYAKRAVELGQTVIATTEHGWFGNQFEVNNLAKKYNLKWIFGAEVYWVWDRHEQDKTNCHMILLAKNERGRQAITEAVSTANEDGYYFKARVDRELLLALPADDVVVTTACVAGWNYGYEKTDTFILELFSHFGANFFLEVQAHHTDPQRELNCHLLSLHREYGIPLIAGMDSHYIYPNQAAERDDFLLSQKIHYDEEEGWFMDYPDEETFFTRFVEQGVLSKDEIREAIENTNICLTFEDYTKDNRIFTPTPKIPVPEIFKGKSQDEINALYSRLISKKFQEYMKNVDPKDYDRYFKGVKEEVNVYKETNMALYPLLDYLIVQEAVKNGGMITPTGRGSGVSFFTNTLCGFSKVDRFKVPIPLYPERFISKTRILESNSLPDLDLNLGNPEVFEAAQKKIMGDDHAAPMIAWGTVKKKNAFKLYARAKGLDFATANAISAQLGNFDTAYANADDDEKDMIDIYDYVDEKYHNYLDASRAYWGIAVTKSRAPCAHLLYDGSIRREIGIIRCKSASTKREYLVAAMDGSVAESMKFLKNDLLKVDSVLLLNLLFKRIGEPLFDTEELTRRTKGDEKTWEIYSKGLTQCINQCERASTTEKLKRYMPESVAELSYFIAAIRPGFKSMYRTFESREKFEYGISALDKLLQTKDMHSSFMIFQENVMGVLNYAGFPMSETYQIIKNIAKKHPEKVRPLKARFIEGFTARLIEDDKQDSVTASENAERVWQIINDNCSYSFNSCLAGNEKIFRGTSRYNNLSIEEMYLTMNNKEWAVANGHRSLYDKYKRSGYGFAYSKQEDRIKSNKIVDIRPAGVRMTYKVTTESGKAVVATDNHKFPTPNGEKRLDELKAGDFLYVKGKYEKKYFDTTFTDDHKAKNLPKKGQSGFQKIENGDSVVYHKFRKDRIDENCPCDICKKEYSSTERFEVHHKDGNRKNNEYNNYQWLCASCHKKIHYKNFKRVKKGENGWSILLDSIVSIEPDKEQMTYDVEMMAPYHNFMLENGLIVSNSHAVSMAYDSLYLAYLKAHHPYEFYETVLQFYSEKGNKDKVRLIKQEMRQFGIREGAYKFGTDNRRFRADPEHHIIVPSLVSIKGLSKSCAETLFQLGRQKYESFLDLYFDLKKSGIHADQLSVLIHLDYFSDFANQRQIDELIVLADEFDGRASLKFDEKKEVLTRYWTMIEPYLNEKGEFICELPDTPEHLKEVRDKKLDELVLSLKRITKTKKAALEAIKAGVDYPEVSQYLRVKTDYDTSKKELIEKITNLRISAGKDVLYHLQGYILQNLKDYSRITRIQRQYKDLQYLIGDYSKVDSSFRIVASIDSKYATKRVGIYEISSGEERLEKIFANTFAEAPLNPGDIIKVVDERYENKRYKNENGDWVPSDQKEWILRRYVGYSA